MQHNKLPYWLILGLLCLCIVSAFYLLAIKKQPLPDQFMGLPPNTEAILLFNDIEVNYHRFAETLYGQQWQQSPPLLNSKLLLSSFLNITDDFKNTAKNTNSLVCAFATSSKAATYNTKASDIKNWETVVIVKNDYLNTKLADIIAYWQDKGVHVNTPRHDKYPTYKVSVSDKSNRINALHISQRGNLIFVGLQPDIVENACLAYTNKLAISSLQYYQIPDEHADANLFLLNPLLKKTDLPLLNALINTPLAQAKLKDYKDDVALQFNLYFNANGIDAEGWLKPQEAFLPKISISNNNTTEQVNAKDLAYLMPTNTLLCQQNFVDNATAQKARKHLPKKYKWLGQQWAYALLPNPVKGNANIPILYFSLKQASKSTVVEKSLLNKQRTDYKKRTLYTPVEVKDLTEHFFNSTIAEQFNEAVAIISNDVLIICPNPQLLMAVLIAIETNNTLGNSTAYAANANTLPAIGTYYYYSPYYNSYGEQATTNAPQLATADLTNQAVSRAHSYPVKFSIGNQIQFVNGHADNQNCHLHWGYQNNTAVQSVDSLLQLAWVASIEDQNIQALYVSETDQNNPIIFAETDKYYLRAYNLSGNLQFVYGLESEIVGAVHTVDFYNNGQQQYLFSTKYKVHCIDNNGYEMPNYPRTLPAVNVGGLSTASLKRPNEPHVKSYFFVRCKTNEVYGYQLNGSFVEGFNPLYTQANNTLHLPQVVYTDKGTRLVALSDDGKEVLWYNFNGRFLNSTLLGKNVLATTLLIDKSNPKSESVFVATQQAYSFNLPNESANQHTTTIYNAPEKSIAVIQKNIWASKAQHERLYLCQNTMHLQSNVSSTYINSYQLPTGFMPSKVIAGKSVIGAYSKTKQALALCNTAGKMLHQQTIIADSCPSLVGNTFIAVPNKHNLLLYWLPQQVITSH